MRFALVLSFWAILSVSAGAQDWATAEVCDVETPVVSEEAFAPGGFSELLNDAGKIPNSNGKFWQITSPEGHVSYLWGTFHSSDPLILRLPDEVRHSIETSRAIAVEIDYTFQDRDAYRRAQMMEGRFLDASDPFEFESSDATIAGLSEEVSGWIRDRALELGWTEDFDLVMSLPGIAEMLLSDPCEDFNEGVLPIQDDYIQLLGRLAGADIIGLEKHDELIADLGADEDTTRAVIGVYAAYLKPMDSNTERSASFALYLEGRLGLMQAWDYSYQREIHGPEGLDKLRLADAYLIEFRNRRFLDRLADQLPRGGVFLAVGSAHLPGETGLVELLRERGYDVTRAVLPGEIQ